MQHNLRLIQFFLNLHNAICLLRVLVFYNVFFELGKVKGWVGVSEGRSWVARQEFIDYFGEKLMGHEGRVVGIADYYSGNSFSATIGVECIG